MTLLNWKHLALALSTALFVWLILFSSFFTNMGGLADSIRTYLPWLKRAGGASPHIHPWSFYLERLAWYHPVKGPAWSEGLILALAVVGAGVSLLGKKSPLRVFLVFYTVALTAAYSLISYKTPWCLLSFWHGMILLAGIGAAAGVELFRARPVKVLILAMLVALTAQLTCQAWRASFEHAADRRNPYVYSQTVPSALKLVERVEAISRVHPGGHELIVKVAAPNSDYGPLPWYLRRFQHVGWYDTLPADPYAPIIIASTKFKAALDDQSDKRWLMVGIFELRPGVFFELYVELELWTKFVATLPREKD